MHHKNEAVDGHLGKLDSVKTKVELNSLTEMLQSLSQMSNNVDGVERVIIVETSA